MMKVRKRVGRRGAMLVLAALAILVPAAVAAAGSNAKVHSTTFKLFANPATVACAKAPGKTPTVTATVTRGRLNDTMTLNLAGFKPGLDFDLFTVQRSNQRANGTPVPGFTNFGLAWYQSDIQIGSNGTGTVTVRTILLDQIFGFDPDAALVPINTFHVGFWFNSPADATACGFTGTTPFNGEHAAGPLAFITRPLGSGLGPLCTDPNLTTSPHSCNP